MADGSIDLLSLIIGSATTLGGTILAHKLESDKKKAEEKEQTIEEINLIRTEISKLWDIYKIDIGKTIERASNQEPILRPIPIGKNTFVFFDAAPSSLTKIDRITAEEIIQWYVKAKNLVEQIEKNNNDVNSAQKFSQAQTQQRRAEHEKSVSSHDYFHPEKTYQANLNEFATISEMNKTATAIKKSYRELENLTNTSITKIDSALEKLNQKTPTLTQRLFKKIKDLHFS